MDEKMALAQSLGGNPKKAKCKSQFPGGVRQLVSKIANLPSSEKFEQNSSSFFRAACFTNRLLFSISAFLSHRRLPLSHSGLKQTWALILKKLQN
jgi:hypothetical protein